MAGTLKYQAFCGIIRDIFWQFEVYRLNPLRVTVKCLHKGTLLAFSVLILALTFSILSPSPALSYALSISATSGAFYAPSSAVTSEPAYYYFIVSNEGTTTDSFSLSAANSDGSWTTTFHLTGGVYGSIPSADAVTSISSLGAGSTKEVFILITPPVGASAGSLNTTEVTVSSINDSSKKAVATFETQVGIWTTVSHDPRRTGRSPYKDLSYGGLQWSVNLNGSSRSSPAVAPDGTIYVGGATGIWAINPDGTVKWFRNVGGPSYSAPATGKDGSIYFAGFDNKFYAYTCDGTQEWATTLYGGYSSPAIGQDGTIYVGGYSDGKIYAVNPSGSVKWTYTTSSYIEFPPAIGYDGVIYVSCYDGYLYALYPNGTLKWRVAINPYGGPAVGPNGIIYVASGNGYIFGITPNNGSTVYTYPLSSCRSTPSIGADGIVYATDGNGNLYAFYPNLSQKWNRSIGAAYNASPVIGYDGTIYQVSYNTKLYAIDSGGTTLWTFSAEAGSQSTPALAPDTTLYFTATSNLYSLFPDWAPPTVEVITPNSPGITLELYKGTSTYEITWTAIDYKGFPLSNNYINLYFSSTEGTSWTTIAAGLINNVSASQGAYVWDIPYITSYHCLISVEAKDRGSNLGRDVSANIFTIINGILDTAYVSPEGNDISGNGSQVNPFKTIGKALDMIKDGGTIMVAAGIYTGNGGGYGIGWHNKNNISLYGAGSNETIISAEALGQVISVEGRVNLTIEALTIKGGKINAVNTGGGGGIFLPAGSKLWIRNVNFISNEAWNLDQYVYGGALYCNGASVFADGCMFQNNYCHGSQYEYYNGGGVAYGGTWEVNNCVFRGNKSYAIGGVFYGSRFVYCRNSLFASNEAGDFGSVAALDSSSYAEVSNCIFSGNLQILTWGSSWDVKNCVFNNNYSEYTGGAIGGSNTYWKVANSTFYNNTSYNVPAVSADVGTDVNWKVKNSIFWGSDNSFRASGGGTVASIEYSDVQGGWGNFVQGPGNISANPRFASTLEGDPAFLRLGGGSACLDTGTYETDVPSRDAAGNVRPHGFKQDMGAYEFQGPSISVESPNGGEKLYFGSTWPVKWLISGEVSGNVKVWLSANKGITWDTLITSETAVPQETTYVWTIPYIGSTECLVSVEAFGNGVWNYDTSNSTFEIPADVTPPQITYEAPKGMVTLEAGVNYDIKWSATDNLALPPSNYISIYYSTQEGNWITITSSQSNNRTATSGAYSWKVPREIAPVNSTSYGYISVEARDMANNKDYDISSQFKFTGLLSRVYVTPEGGGSDGSAADPYESIQMGLNRVAENGSVEAAAGVYHEHDIIWSERNNVTLRGTGSNETIISAEALGRVFSVGSAVHLSMEALCIRDGKCPNQDGGGIYLISGSAMNLKNVKIMNSYAQASLSYSPRGGAIFSPGSTVTAEGCSFLNNFAEGYGGVAYGGKWEASNCSFIQNKASNTINMPHIGNGGVFDEVNITRLTGCKFISNDCFNGEYGGVAHNTTTLGTAEVTDCIFINNLGQKDGGVTFNCDWNVNNCIFQGNSSFNGGVGRSGNWNVHNCSFYGNSGANGDAFYSVNCNIVNSIFWANVSNAPFRSSSGTIRYSEVQNWDLGGLGNGGNNINTNPVFSSTQEGDPNYFRLSGGSPCIDTGTLETGVPTKDAASITRPHGFKTDMGVYEFLGPSIRVVYPNGGEVIKSPVTAKISWEVSDYPQTITITNPIRINYSYDGGNNWNIVTAGTSKVPPYIWVVPGTISTECLVSIQASDDAGILNYDTSNATFEIKGKIFTSEVWVSATTGDDINGTGTPEKPYQTIANAITYVATGGALYAYAGTYYEYDIRWSPFDNITLKPTPETAACTIDALGINRGISIEAPIHVTIEGITIKGGNTTIGNGAGIFLAPGGNLYLRRVNISNCYDHMTGTYDGGGAIYAELARVHAWDCAFLYNSCRRYGGVGRGGTWEATRCIFSHNYTPDSGGVFDHAHVLFAVNCLFDNNKADTFCGVIKNPQNVQGQLINCTFYNNSGPAAAAIGGGTWGIINSVFWGSAANPAFDGGVVGTIEYSDVQYGYLSQLVAGNGVINENPKVVSGSDFHLQADSPCIDTGTYEGAPFDDLEKKSRPDPANPPDNYFFYDMGCYEQVGTGIPRLTVIQPNGGEELEIGVTYEVKWKVTGAITSDVYIRLSTNEGATWDVLITQGPPLAGTFTYNWIPSADYISTECRISLEAAAYGGWGYDISDANFWIAQPKPRTTEVWVSSDRGNDLTGSGTVENPYKTIAYSLTRVATNGAIRAYSGTYYERNLNWPRFNGITLMPSNETSVCTIDAQLLGRAIIVPYTVDLSIEGFIIQNGGYYNKSGGAINLINGCTLHLNDVTISKCSAEGYFTCYGGAVFCTDLSVKIFAQDCRFLDNRSQYGGAIYRGTWNTTNCAFANNSTSYAGAGGVTYLSNFNANGCTFEGNNSPYGGVGSGGTWNASRSIFKNNHSAYGGGISEGGVWTAVNCIFSGNTASREGGVGSDSNFIATNCVFYNNTANMGTREAVKGGVWYPTNCIFWGGNDQFNGTTGTMKNCDVQNSDWGSFTATKDCISIDPLFVNAPVGNFHLLSTSECVNSGTFEGAPTMDAEGILRPQPAGDPVANFDIGAYEQAGPAIPKVTVIKPNGGETLTTGVTYDVTWKIIGTVTTNIYVRLSTNEGLTWDTLITQETGKTGVSTHEWKPTTPLISGTCLISVDAGGPDGWDNDVSNATFEIVAPIDHPPVVTVETPNGGESVKGGDILYIRWKATDDFTPENALTIRIYYASGEAWNYIITTSESLSGVGTYEWTPSGWSSTEVKIRVSATDELNNTGSDESNAFFTIDSFAPAITLITPEAGITLEGSKSFTVKWIATDEVRLSPEAFTIWLKRGGTNWELLVTGISSLDTTYSWSITGTDDPICYISIEAKDTVGHVSSKINGPFSIMTPPKKINDLVATSLSTQEIMLTWTATSDNVPPQNITSYEGYLSTEAITALNFGSPSQIPLILGPPKAPGLKETITIEGLEDKRVYYFAIKSRDNFWNWSAISNIASAETKDAVAPNVTVISPNGGEIIKGGDKLNISWTAYDNTTPPANLTIRIYYSSSDAWQQIATTKESSSGIGTYEWTTSDKWSSKEVRVRVTATDEQNNIATDESDAKFSIDSLAPIISVLSPEAGATLEATTGYTIRWAAADEVMLSPEAFTIWYTVNNGASWTKVLDKISSSQTTYAWTVPDVATTEARISMEAKDKAGHTGYGISAKFRIKKVYAAGLWVSLTGNDSNDGSMDYPYRTIAKGLSMANTGDTVYISGGEYDEWNLPWPNKNNVTLKAFEMNSPVTIDAKSVLGRRIITLEAVPNANVVNLTIEGITLQGARSNGDGGGIRINKQNTNLWLKNVTIQVCSIEGSFHGAGVQSYDNTVKIFAQNCVFQNNYTPWAAGVCRYGTWTLKDCIFYNNRAASYGGVANEGLYTATNCIFIKNSSANGGFGYSGITLTATNCVFYGNSVLFSGVGGTLRYCDVQKDSWNVLSQTTCTSAEPMFISTVEGMQNFHLRPGSPCIDSGTKETGVPTADAEGHYCPRGLGVDMGPYEFQGPSVSILSPNGGENFGGDTSNNITWRTSDEGGLAPKPITIRYSVNGGSSWLLITKEVDDTGIYTWETPPVTSSTVLISIEVVNSLGVWNCDTSNSSFEIVAPIVWVSTTGDDINGDGTQFNPFRTIAKGLSVVGAGQKVYVIGGTYNEWNIPWPNKNNVTLRKAIGETSPVTIDAGGQLGRRLITIESVPNANVTNLTIEGITLQMARVSNLNGGGLYLNKSSINVWLNTVVFQNCSAEGSGRGGAVYAKDNTVQIFAQNGIFTNNIAGDGGGLGCYGLWIISNCTFAGNSAAVGGAFRYSIATVEGCTFNWNRSTYNNGSGYGGGVIDEGNISARYCTFEGNSAYSFGGVAALTPFEASYCTFKNNNTYGNYAGGVAYGGTWNVSSCEFINNSAAGSGGVTDNSNGTVSYSTFKNNSSGSHGGVANNSSWTVSYSTFKNNNALSNAYGGVSCNGIWIVTNCTFEGNHASNRGGVKNGGTLYAKDSSFNYNDVTNEAGGVSFLLTAFVATRCAFVGNFSKNGGAGVDQWSYIRAFDCVFSNNYAPNGGVFVQTVVTLENCTLYGNFATTGNGGVANGCLLNARNSIFWANRAINGPAFYGMDTRGALRYCDVQKDGWNPLTQTQCISFEPMFVSTAENNFHPQAGSPCIDAGTFETGVPTIDADGSFRPRGLGLDMGPYEFRGPSIVVLSPNGGETYYSGAPVTITWKTSDEGGLRTSPNPITIRYSANMGLSWSLLITKEVENTGIYTWEAPQVGTRNGLISVEVVNSSGVWNCDTSNAIFEIVAPVIWVSTTGDDINGDGTLFNPYQTIAKGLSVVGTDKKVYVFGGTYNEWDILWPNKNNVTLKASMETTPVTIDAGSVLGRRGIRVESVANVVNLTIEGITIQRGRINTGNGAAMNITQPYTKIWLKNVTVQNCSAEGGSCAGIYSVDNSVNIFARDSLFANGLCSPGVGGGVAVNGTWNAINCRFVNNKCLFADREYAGGGVAYYGSWEVTDCTFEGNVGEYGGVAREGNWTATNCTFRGNYCYKYGSVFYGKGLNYKFIANSCTFDSNYGPLDYLTLKYYALNSTYKNNYGIVECGSNWVATGCAFSNNVGPNGGAVAYSGNLIMEGCTITNNWASSEGGVGYGANLTVNNCTFEGNGSKGSGGVASGGIWNITNSKFSANYSTTGGGGVFYNGTMSATNCVFTGNSATGGGVTNANNFNVTRCTFEANRALTGDGGVAATNGTWNARECTFKNNICKQYGGVSRGNNWNVIDSNFINNSSEAYQGGVFFQGTWVATRCAFVGNRAPYGGGVGQWTPVTAFDCVFISNEAWSPASQQGGGVNLNANWTVFRCTFEANKCGGDGGIDENSTWYVTDSTLKNNRASGSGGVTYNSTWTVTNCAFIGNVASLDGGVANIGAAWKAKDCTFINNLASRDAGVAYNVPWTASNCAFNGNSANRYGGVARLGKWNVWDSTFSNNTAGDSVSRGWGGVIYDTGGSANTWTLTNCAFTANHANLGGGIGYYAYIKAVNCTFTSNEAIEPFGPYSAGGGVATGSTVEAINCVFKGNRAGYSGGVGQTGTWALANCTFYKNKTEAGGSGGVAKGGIWNATNSIFWANTAPTGPVFNGMISGGKLTKCDLQGTNWDTLTTRECITTDPKFMSTAEGAENLRLKASSSCIDTGSTEGMPNEDIERTLRPRPSNGKKDIGAYEYGGGATPPPAFRNTNKNTAYYNLNVALSDANAGDIILIPSGDFSDVAINWPNINNLTLSGEGSGMTTLEGNGNSPIVSIPGVTASIEGITFVGGGGTQGGAISVESGTVDVKDCVFSGNQAGNGGAGAVASKMRFLNCVFVGNSATGTGGALYGKSSNISVINCTFYGNNSSVQGGAVYIDSLSTLDILNSILWNNSPDQIAGTGAITVNYSDIQGGWGGTANISTEPRFVSTTESDFHLNGSSPCIDTAASAGAPDHDIEKNSRPKPLGGFCDMGAYEYGGGATPPPPIVNADTGAAYYNLNIAINNATENDTIKLPEGDYSNVAITWPQIQNLTLTGEGTDKTVLTGIGDSSIINISNVTANISGIKFVGGGGIQESTIVVSNGTAIISNCAFVASSGIVGSNLIMENCLWIGGRTIHGSPDANIKIVNCTFYGVSAEAGQPGGAFYMEAGGTLDILNSILWNNTPDQVSGEGTITVNYSDIQGGWTGTGNITFDPQFVSPSVPSGDFHLQPTSPCIDTATPEGAPPFALGYIRRPQGLGVDMGCYEWSNYPEITVKINGERFLDGGLLSPGKTNSVEIKIYCISNVPVCEMYVDSVPVIPLAKSGSTPQWMWSGSFASPAEGTHQLTFFASSEVLKTNIVTLEAKVIGGGVQAIGIALNYPNPFKPMSGQSTSIQYTLTEDAPVTLMIYDITGHEVKRFVFASGQNGGKANINTVSWDGRSLFNKVVGNGMYIYRITTRGKVLSTGKLVILD